LSFFEVFGFFGVVFEEKEGERVREGGGGGNGP
jgi:hypothetical protein